MAVQNQYNLIHQTVPESPCTLLPDQENIKRVMNEKFNKKLKGKAKSSVALSESNGKSKKQASRGSAERVRKKVHTKKFCQRCKTRGRPWEYITWLQMPLSKRIH